MPAATAPKFRPDATVDGYRASNGYTIVRTYAPACDLTMAECRNGVARQTFYRSTPRRGSTVYGYEVRDPSGKAFSSTTTVRSAKASVINHAERVDAAMTDAQRATFEKVAAFYTIDGVWNTQAPYARVAIPTAPIVVAITGPDGVKGGTYTIAVDGTPERA